MSKWTIQPMKPNTKRNEKEIAIAIANLLNLDALDVTTFAAITKFVNNRNIMKYTVCQKVKDRTPITPYK